MSNELIKVSVIVPVYNVENYLDKCLESIINQSFKDMEIILIDDGSTDDSGKICLKWQERDNRIIYIKKKNEGPGPTRDFGVSIAKGKYISFVDSDDWIEKDAIESMYNAAEESNADIVMCDINYVVRDKNGKVNSTVSKLRIDENRAIKTKEDIRFIDKGRLNAWGKLYKKEFYKKCNVMQPAHAFEDAAVIPLLIAKSNIIYHVPKALYNYYRSRPESIISSCKYKND